LSLFSSLFSEPGDVGLWPEPAGKKQSTTKGGRRMYIGLGTVLLIVLIIILLIWAF
jgi:hypothetical protein